MPRIVLDSNVLISALHFGGVPEALVFLASQGEIELFVSPFILEETARILQERFAWGETKTRDALTLIKAVATVIDPKQVFPVIPDDEADNHILACAVEARADFLVTGDKRHILPLKHYQGIRILTPRDCLELLRR